MTKNKKTTLRLLAVHPRSGLRFCRSLFFVLTCLVFSVAQGQTTNYALGTTALLVGSAAGTNSVVFAVTPSTGTWTATTNATWLHLSLANQSGTGSTNVIFSCDANLGVTRSGTLTIGNQTLTVTQAGSTYIAADPQTTLVTLGVNSPVGVAVDGADNVYFINYASKTIQEWSVANNTVTTLVPPASLLPTCLAVDDPGNAYFVNNSSNTIQKWAAANSNLTTLVSFGSTSIDALAVDLPGNIYFANGISYIVQEWTVANSNLTTLVSSGLGFPRGLAVDVAGNVYIGDVEDGIKKWTAANSNLTTLVSGPSLGVVAVDGGGNVYIQNSALSGGQMYNVIQEWIAANSNITTLSSNLTFASDAFGVAVDGSGNVYFADPGSNSVKELPHAFVDPTPKRETAAAGNDTLPAVLPTTANLLGPFAPTSDQSWLTITGITNGMVSFSFTANTGPARTAHITLLGQAIPITQGVIGTPPTLTSVQMLGNGVIQFAFTNTPGASFTVLSTTNVSLPLTNWTGIGPCTNTASNLFQFTSQPTTNDAQRFYTVRSP